jgi:nitrate reductase cytochrome c-type subunit
MKIIDKLMESDEVMPEPECVKQKAAWSYQEDPSKINTTTQNHRVSNLLQTLGCKQPKATDENGAKRLVEIINYS